MSENHTVYSRDVFHIATSILEKTLQQLSIVCFCEGGVKVIVDVGFFRDEVNTAIPDVDLTNGQQHVVSVRRYNRGRKIVVAVSVTNQVLPISLMSTLIRVCVFEFKLKCL